MSRITAAVCTYNRYPLLDKCLESLIAQTLDKATYDIVVVDNSPDCERAAEHAKRYADVPNLTYLIERMPGLSNARNVAARHSGAEFINYIDDDAIAFPDLLQHLLDAAGRYGDKAGVIGGRINPIWEIERPKWLHEQMLGHVSVVNWGGVCRIAAESEWFAGANITFRRATLLEHGGFATNLGRKGAGATLLSNEEIELVDAIRKAGYHMIYAPDAQVDHLVERSRLTRDWFRKRTTWQAVSDFIMKPEEQIRQLAHDRDNLRRFINSMPPLLRNFEALIHPTDDPDLFRWQLSAHYSMTRLELAGFEGLEHGV